MKIQKEISTCEMIHLVLTQETQLAQLCNEYFNLQDLLWITSREIGTGHIGEKSVGMLLAQKIIKSVPECENVQSYFEMDDSFFIGTDVFYDYIVQNNLLELWKEQKTEKGYFKCAQAIQTGLLQGEFSEEIENAFIHMLEYFGKDPIVVRSSSLQEDGFGSLFAGKYESIFCVNQGTFEERLDAFKCAVRTVYASTMNLEVLKYRLQRGLSVKDEQMAVLVQKVAGQCFGDYFFPHVAGMGNSSNLYVWEPGMNARTGMLRIVFGLGTRAVAHGVEDYVRLVSLDDPEKCPLLGYGDGKKYSQHKIDVLNLRENKLCSIDIEELAMMDICVNKNLFIERDYEEVKRLRELGYGYEYELGMYSINLKKMLTETSFSKVMRKVLKVLSDKYKYPVDVEFAVNFISDRKYKINLVQCRPLQTRKLGKTAKLPVLNPEYCFFFSKGNFMGGNVKIALDYIIFVNVNEYVKCTETDKYNVARHIGKVNEKMKNRYVLLMGPGRWGSTTPSLGVPVHFMEINNMAAICEISYRKEAFMPELSYGSHFFQDMVETGIFYIALFQDSKDVTFQPNLLSGENMLKKISPESEKYEKVIWVIPGNGLEIYSDVMKQQVICAKAQSNPSATGRNAPFSRA